MAKAIVISRKGLIQQCQCDQIIAFVVKPQPLGNSRQDVFILQPCLKSDVVARSGVIFYRHIIWFEMERNRQIARLL